MRIMGITVLVAAVSLSACASAHAATPSRRILVMADEIPPLQISQIEVNGRAGEHLLSFNIVVLDTGRTTISGNRNGVSLGQVSLNDANFDGIDFETIQIRTDMTGDVAQVRAKFGVERAECFVNHDGRDSFTVHFVAGQSPAIYVTSHELCETRMTRVS